MNALDMNSIGLLIKEYYWYLLIIPAILIIPYYGRIFEMIINGIKRTFYVLGLIVIIYALRDFFRFLSK